MRLATGVVAVATLVASTVAAFADDTGVAGIHAWRQAGGRTCFEDHYHQGTGVGTTQRGAMVEGIKSWESFTALEYGSDWALYSNSISKSATCSQGQSGFECQISSIPCKGGALARHDRRPSVKRRTTKPMHAE